MVLEDEYDEEQVELLNFFDEGRVDGFDAGVEFGLRRLLASPEFLFRVEREPPDALPATPYRVGALELASRLSFFLWSSIPDEPLLEVAIDGSLLPELRAKHPVRTATSVPRQFKSRGRGRLRLLAGSLALSLF